MGDLRLPQFSDAYDGHLMRIMVQTLENLFNNISRVLAFTRKGAYQIHADIIPVGNVGGGEDTLITYTLPANILANEGCNIEIIAWGTVAANANNKTIKLYFGSSVIYSTGALAANNGVWNLRAIVTRTGDTAEQAITTMISSNTLIAYGVTFNVPSEDLSATITIKCTGTATSNNDVVQDGLLVRVYQQS